MQAWQLAITIGVVVAAAVLVIESIREPWADALTAGLGVSIAVWLWRGNGNGR